MYSKNKFGIKSTEQYYKQIRNECEDFVLHNVDVTTIDKMLKNLDAAKASGIDQISARFLKDGAPVTTCHLSLTNLSIKLDTFPSKCKTAKIKPLFKRGIKIQAKNYRPVSLLSLISKVIDRKIDSQSNTGLSSKN